MSAADLFRAQCASCMRVILDPTAVKCPACGSDRLVVHVGKQTKAAVSAAAKSQRTRFDPLPIAETCDVCGAQPGMVCDMAKHRKDPLETRYRKSKAARKWWANRKMGERPQVILLPPAETDSLFARTFYEALLFAEKRGDAGITRNGKHLVADLSVALALLESLRE